MVKRKKVGKDNKLSASMLKSFEKEIKSESKEIEKLEKKIDGLSKKIDETTKTNIELQENIAELMVHFTEMANNIKTIVSSTETLPDKENDLIFEDISPKEEEVENKRMVESPELNVSKDVDPSEIKEQLLMLAKEKKELMDTLRSLEKQFKKDETRKRIEKALKKTGGI